MTRIHAIKEQRASLHKQQQDILEQANEAGLTAEDEAKFDAIEAEFDQLDQELAKLEKVNQRAQARQAELAKASPQTQDFVVQNGRLHEEAEQEAVDLFANFDGHDRKNALAAIANSDANKALRAEFDAFLISGIQANLQHTKQADGGYLVMPEQYVARMIQNVDDIVHMRRLATIISLTSARSIGVPTRDSDISDPQWTSELGTGDEDESLTFGKRKMVPQPLAKRIRISRDLLRINTLNAEAIVRQRLAYKFGVAQENGFMTGSGADQPLGLFVAHPDGVPTSRDVATGNTTTALTADGLIEAKYSLKEQYMMSPMTRWLFHRDAVKRIRKMRYGTNTEEFVWKPGLQDRPDTILEVPYVMSEFAPNTFTASQYVGMIGDFSHYWVVEVMTMELQRLVELYAASNQVGFIGRAWLDGAPTLPEAFARIQLAAS